jgi:Flp pilus assembly protein TadG
MTRFFNDERGATALEFAIAFPPILFLTLGIFQTALFVWTDNLLHYAVDVAARCAAVSSTKAPCTGDLETTASGVFNASMPASWNFGTVTFPNGDTNPSCTANAKGITMKFTATLRLVPLPSSYATMTAQSCYPTYP